MLFMACLAKRLQVLISFKQDKLLCLLSEQPFCFDKTGLTKSSACPQQKKFLPKTFKNASPLGGQQMPRALIIFLLFPDTHKIT